MSIGYFQWTKIGCFRWTRSGSFRRTLTIGLFIVVIKIIWVLIKSIRPWVIIGSIIVMGSISKVAFSVATDLKISVFLLQTVALCLVLLVPIIIGSVRLKHQSN